MTEACNAARVFQDRWTGWWVAVLWNNEGRPAAKVERTWAEAFAWAAWWTS